MLDGMARLLELISGDAPEAWARVGFAAGGDGVVRIGGIGVRPTGAGGGLLGWVLEGSGPASVDGVETSWLAAAPVDAAGDVAHPNAAVALDHVVLFTDHRDRTVDALVAAGGDERRRAGPPAVPVEMAFVRMGDVIVEGAEGPPTPAGAPLPASPSAARTGRAARLSGLVAVVEDLDG